MAIHIRRRELVVALGGAAVAWPFGTRAQQQPVIGFLSGSSPEVFGEQLHDFREGLKQSGYMEGQNVSVEYRWAQNQQNRLPALASDLVSLQVDVIVTTGGSRSALAAQAATSTIPIVFITGDDPVRLGLVASLNRPGGNVTGVTFLTTSLEAKRLDLLRELVPTATVIGILVNPNFPDAEIALTDVPAAARSLGQQIEILKASSAAEIDAAFATLSRLSVKALLVTSDPFFSTQRGEMAALAARHAIPTMYWRRDFVAVGGLISYGSNLGDSYRQFAVYAGRILKGDKPADLPVLQPTRFDLVINLKSAKALRLEVPAKLLALADEAIE
jgi:putative ABC transport system substrate-binding protein